MKRFLVLLSCLALTSCTMSYYDSYVQSHNTNPYTGYSYYNAPLRVRGLSTSEVQQLNTAPREYINTQMWGAAGHIGHFAIHNVFQVLPR